jgi:hypothetical protein
MEVRLPDGAGGLPTAGIMRAHHTPVGAVFDRGHMPEDLATADGTLTAIAAFNVMAVLMPLFAQSGLASLGSPSFREMADRGRVIVWHGNLLQVVGLLN